MFSSSVLLTGGGALRVPSPEAGQHCLRLSPRNASTLMDCGRLGANGTRVPILGVVARRLLLAAYGTRQVPHCLPTLGDSSSSELSASSSVASRDHTEEGPASEEAEEVCTGMLAFCRPAPSGIF